MFVALALGLLGLCLLFGKRPSVKTAGYLLTAVAHFLNALDAGGEGRQKMAYFSWVAVVIFSGFAARNIIDLLSASKVPPQAKEDGK
jgi:hypothetical protein